MVTSMTVKYEWSSYGGGCLPRYYSGTILSSNVRLCPPCRAISGTGPTAGHAEDHHVPRAPAISLCMSVYVRGEGMFFQPGALSTRQNPQQLCPMLPSFAALKRLTIPCWVAAGLSLTSFAHLERLTFLCIRSESESHSRLCRADHRSVLEKLLPPGPPAEAGTMSSTGFAHKVEAPSDSASSWDVPCPALDTMCVYWRRGDLDWSTEEMTKMLDLRAQAGHPIRRLVLGRPRDWDDEEMREKRSYHPDWEETRSMNAVRRALEGHVEELVEVEVTKELDIADPSSAPDLSWVEELPAVCRDPEETHRYWPAWG
ncbi:hypothetical protein C8Q76DRAFT_15866 [Earliella scabrosa]|nr:hypothetical protein C8Q76DRAFT_15866 [Earliella scabrosa]